MTDLERLRQELEEISKKLGTSRVNSRAYRLLTEKKASLEAKLTGLGAIAQGEGATAIGSGGLLIDGDRNTVILIGNSAQIVIGEQPVEIKTSLRQKPLGRYLEHVIAHNRYLQLQGIRSGGKLVNIELEQIYITLRTTQQRTNQAEDEWLGEETRFAPGEKRKIEQPVTETVNMRVEQALDAHRHLVVLGDPGSGKTTLLRYLALLYGRDLAQGNKIIKDKLGLAESGYLPVLLPLRQIGQFLKAYYPKDDGADGHVLLLAFLFQSLKNHKLDLLETFFDEYLEKGRAVVLLDGMDEVADPALRARVARLVEDFTLSYSNCRFVVTSRVVGYSGAARLGIDYVTTAVRDFTLADVEEFLKHWHRLVAVGQMGAGDSADAFASGQTAQLMNAIQANERVRELAINPLMLTVIALVHRDRVKLPDRRAELYAEAVDVLLGKWDEARGVDEIRILDDRPFDAGDRRLLLQSIALYMHERQMKEISAEDLRRLLSDVFVNIVADRRGVRKAVENFQRVIEERTGLLTARGEGVYAFSHLTFQEYLAALAIAARDDYVEYVLARSDKAWWREVILLEAGFLSTQSKERTTKLIKSIAEKKSEPELYYNLMLAAECLRDVGDNRVDGRLGESLSNRLLVDFKKRPPENVWGKIQQRFSQGTISRRVAAANALAQIGGGRKTYWSQPYGEPEWVNIPNGEFRMGGEDQHDGKPIHKLVLPEYQIAKVLLTNAQYAIFVKTSGQKAPSNWEENRPPKGREKHPVVSVSWEDAIAYCAWLSSVTGKHISLPSEAEWEKAARGTNILGKEKNEQMMGYPWGDEFDASRCNTAELGLGDTTPVGIFVEGASPYGLLDMSGNVWEWTRSIWDDKFKYPYEIKDGRENLTEKSNRVLRGGSFSDEAVGARCPSRNGLNPNATHGNIGFRVVITSGA